MLVALDPPVAGNRAIIEEGPAEANPRSAGTPLIGVPEIWGWASAGGRRTISGVDGQRARRTRQEVVRLARVGLDWVTFATEASDAIRRVLPFDRACWHTVDPGTVLFTGSLNQNVTCSGAWLAEHEYVTEDVNKWWFLASSGRLAGASSLATHGDLSRSPRHRSHEAYGVDDELRGSFVFDGMYWGAAGFLRDQGEPWFSEEDVRFLASLSEPLADGLRRALVNSATTDDPPPHGPGVVVFDERGRVQFISPAAERWIEQLQEVPPPSSPSDSRIVQVVAARARALARPGPARAEGEVPGTDGSRLVVAPLRHPALGWCRRAHRGDHPAGGGQ